MSKKTWARTTAFIGLFWSSMLILEAFWWFWPPGPLHPMVLGTGGLFGVIWCIYYFAKLRR